MIINRLILHNFKRFRDQEIRFSDGITGITGNNGVGKSSVVEAVFFALFGVSGGSIATEHVVSSFAGPSERCEVSLDFRIGADEFTVTRTFRKGKSVHHDAVLTAGGKPRASGVSQVEAEIRKVLGMGPTDFRNTVYAAQKDLLQLLDLTPGKRKEWFLRALGIDYLNKGSQEILKARVEKKEQEIALLQGELTVLSRQDPAEIENLQATIKALEDTVTKQQAAVTERELKFTALADDLKSQNDRRAQYLALKGRATALETEKNDLEYRAGTLQQHLAISAPVDEQEYHRLETAIAGIPAAREEAEAYQKKATEHDAIARERKTIETEIQNIVSRREKENENLTALNGIGNRILALKDQIFMDLGILGDSAAGASAELTLANRREKNLQAVASLKAQSMANAREKEKILLNRQAIEDAGPGGICPLCRQDLGTHIGNVRAEYDALLKKNADESVTIANALAERVQESLILDAQKSRLEEIKTLATKLQGRQYIEAEIARLVARRDEIIAQDVKLASRISAIGYNEETHLASRQRLLELEKAQTRHTEIGKEIARLAGLRAQLAEIRQLADSKAAAIGQAASDLAALQYDPDAGNRLEEQIAGIQQVMTALSREIATATERIRASRDQLLQLTLNRNRIAMLNEQVKEQQDYIEVQKLTRAAIADYVIWLMQAVRTRLEAEVGRIVSEITGGRYDQVLLDEDFNLLVRENGAEYSVARFSGGEQDDIAVALRIALSRYLAELHQVHESTLLIFDEIFGSQDEERRNNLLTALRSQESRFPQILLISHISDIQGEFANTLQVQMGQDQTSVVREVA